MNLLPLDRAINVADLMSNNEYDGANEAVRLLACRKYK